MILAAIYNTLGKSYFELGNYTGAYEDFKDAIKEHKDFAEALSWFDKAFQPRTIGYTIIKRDKQIEGIRNDKRFKELIRKYYK